MSTLTERVVQTLERRVCVAIDDSPNDVKPIPFSESVILAVPSILLDEHAAEVYARFIALGVALLPEYRGYTIGTLMNPEHFEKRYYEAIAGDYQRVMRSRDFDKLFDYCATRLSGAVAERKTLALLVKPGMFTRVQPLSHEIGQWLDIPNS